jgi:hypothetical protein
MKPERPVVLGRAFEEEGSLRKDVNGRELMSKMSPERRMGRVLEYLVVRISRASAKIGVVDGVLLVRGWIVTQSTRRLLGSPITVSRKSMVFLKVVSACVLHGTCF